jgi:hypothetical protein
MDMLSNIRLCERGAYKCPCIDLKQVGRGNEKPQIEEQTKRKKTTITLIFQYTSCHQTKVDYYDSLHNIIQVVALLGGMKIAKYILSQSNRVYSHGLLSAL